MEVYRWTRPYPSCILVKLWLSINCWKLLQITGRAMHQSVIWSSEPYGSRINSFLSGFRRELNYIHNASLWSCDFQSINCWKLLQITGRAMHQSVYGLMELWTIWIQNQLIFLSGFRGELNYIDNASLWRINCWKCFWLQVEPCTKVLYGALFF